MPFPYEPVPAEPGEHFTPRRPKNRTQKQRRIIYIVLAACLLVAVTITLLVRHRRPTPVLDPDDPATIAQHHVDALLARQSATYEQAAARYSLKTGRSPPRGFDKWFEFAQAHSCLIDDYDQIDRDFAPFYQLVAEDPLFLQRRVDIVADFKATEAGVIVIKDGEVHMPQGADLKYWGGGPDTFAKFAHLLPDMSFIINGKDQPRVLFDYRAPDATRERALALTEERPFDVLPHPTAEFFHAQGCEVVRSPTGFAESANGDSGFFLSSSPAWFTLDMYPVLSVTKVSPCFADIVFPSEYYYRRSPASPKYAYPDNIPWADKKPVAYWRGTATGGQIIPPNHHNFTRFRLVALSHTHPDLLDARLTRFADLLCLQEDGCDRESIVREYDIGGGAPQDHSYGYKYAVDVDGMTYSGRFLGLLGSGSLVFKATLFTEYFNDWLVPYTHYVPVRPDLSDLLEKIEWARAHDAEARVIQAQGQEMARRVMTDVQNDCYLMRVLIEWAELQERSRNANAGVL